MWEFIWEARHLDVSYKFLSLGIIIINEHCIGAKLSDPLARASPLCFVYVEDFRFSQARSRVVMPRSDVMHYESPRALDSPV